jgi:glycine betaine/proline transport system substrate-binding protein
LKYLKDPKGFTQDACSIISRRGFQEDQPEAATFFKNFNLEEEQLYEVMSAIADKGEAGLQNGMKLIKYWLILGWNNLED